jgi:threonine dehydrogenase-like Zn-dependent dehydrogenase
MVIAIVACEIIPESRGAIISEQRGGFIGIGSQTHVQRYLEPLMDLIVEGKIDPSFLITHRIGLEESPDAYKTFRDREDGCVKVVIRPNG